MSDAPGGEQLNLAEGGPWKPEEPPKRKRPPVPILFGEVRREGGGGGRTMGLRFAVLVAIAADRRLRPGSRSVGAVLLWRYHPGRIYRPDWPALGRMVGVERRTAWRAREQLLERQYIAVVDGNGVIVPAVESCMPPEQRVDVAWQEDGQLVLPGVADVPVVRDYLRMRRRRVAGADSAV